MPTPEHDTRGAPHRRLLFLAVAGSAILAIAGGATFYYATHRNQNRTDTATSFKISVTANACEPNEITVPGGKRSFEIVNVSDRPIEWEILDDVMVVAERENIAPGFKQTLTAQLAPGEYAITCGLLSNPRGMLHVTESDEARTAAATVNLRTFLGPLSEYKVYLVQQAAAAVAATDALAAAIKAGELDKARTLWLQARAPYSKIEPLAYRFSDLHSAIDPVADYLEKREADPAFTGFHRIELGLFAENTTVGLTPVAQKLVDDMHALQERVGKARLDPALLLVLPGNMAERLAHGRILSGENHYAQSDLADFASNLEGLRKITQLLQAVVKPVDPKLEDQIEAKVAAAQTELSSLEGVEGFPPYKTVDDAKRKAISQRFQELAEVLRRLDAVIGIS